MQPVSADNSTYGANGTVTRSRQEGYDHQGALTYVVAVCCVYALAIFFMIASHVRRRQDKREVDQEISTFLRSQPAIRAAEERQRRRNLKRAMKPFIDLMINKRTIGVQVDSDTLGNIHGSQTFVAMYGVPGTPAFSEKMDATDIVVARTGRRHSHVSHLSHASLFRRQTASTELNPSLLLKENEKSVQCNLSQQQKSTLHPSSATTRSSTPGPPTTPEVQPRHLTVPNSVSNTGLSEPEFMCDLTKPIMFHFDGDSRNSPRSSGHLHFPRSATPRVDDSSSSDTLRFPNSNVVIRIDREELLWAPSPRVERKSGYKALPMEEKISSV